MLLLILLFWFFFFVSVHIGVSLIATFRGYCCCWFSFVVFVDIVVVIGSWRQPLSLCCGGVGMFAQIFSCPTQLLCWGCVVLLLGLWQLGKRSLTPYISSDKTTVLLDRAVVVNCCWITSDVHGSWVCLCWNICLSYWAKSSRLTISWVNNLTN